MLTGVLLTTLFFFLAPVIVDFYDEPRLTNLTKVFSVVFFVALSSLNGNTYHLTKYPVKVTQPGQNKKDWNYGKDGLMNEVFDNYKKLPLSLLQKTLLEINLYHVQSWRLWQYKPKGLKVFLKAFYFIWFSSNSIIIFKVIFPFYFVQDYLFGKLKRLIK